jgi:hypothetical protein
MEKKTLVKLIVLAFFAAGFAAILYACAETASMAKRHPVEVEAAPICSDCHTDWRAAMNHTQTFSMRHRFPATQQSQVCNTCHTQAFCFDCHSHKEELKPSDKYKESPQRAMPHPGDYVSQHMIDGKVNPASCFKCHGRQNNERCRACHR